MRSIAFIRAHRRPARNGSAAAAVDDADAQPGGAGQNAAMRWDRLFDDLETQLHALEQAELAGEVAEQTRAERARIDLAERFAASIGTTLRLRVAGVGPLEGVLVESAREWCVLAAHGDAAGRAHQTLVRHAAMLTVTGLGQRAEPVQPGLQRRLDLAQALRALSRDRAVVRVTDVSGGTTIGTIDRVGRDHLDLGTHPQDVPRRAGAVRASTVLPFSALATLSHR